MHNGVFDTLEEVVKFYNDGGGNGSGLVISNQSKLLFPLNLDSQEEAQLVAFLKSLSPKQPNNFSIPRTVPSNLPVGGRFGADEDNDGDGVSNKDDNCPMHPNTDQAESACSTGGVTSASRLLLPNVMQINKDWGTGYCTQVVVSNTTATDVQWQTQFTPDGTISPNNLSNVQIIEQTGNLLTIEGLSNNRIVKAGQSVNFSYCAERTISTPDAETTLTANIEIKDDWVEGYCAVVKVTNKQETVVDWKTSFTLDGSISSALEGDISSIWNAEYTLIGNTVSVVGITRNNYLLPDQFTEFGFCAQRDNSDKDDRVAPTVIAPTALIGNSALKSQSLLTAFPLSTFGQASASDDIDGTLNAQILSVNGKPPQIENNRLLLHSGRHLIVWQAEDNAGNRGIAQQQVDILPRANFTVNQSGSEGLTLAVEVALNGDAPEYPVEIPFSLSGSAIEGSDYSNLTHKIVIEQLQASDNQQLPKGSITLNLNTDAENAEGNETIIFTMNKDSLSNAIAGKKTQHIVTILEENKPPKVSLNIEQNQKKGRKVTKSGGNVTVTAQAIDPNGDNLTYTWTADSLSNIAETPSDDPSTFIFDPSLVNTGNYNISVAVNDGIAAATERKRSIKIKTVVFTAIGNTDSDGDGILDSDEADDLDGNGILDYLEVPHAEHELEAEGGEGLSGEPGTQLSLGKIAFDSDDQDSSVTEAQIREYLQNNNLPAYQEDSNYTAASIFDYIASDLEEVGASTRIVLTLSSPLTAQSVIRKYNLTSGWSTFFEDANNKIESLIGSNNNCPDDEATNWQAGLVVGGTCLRLTIEDGGRNDADGEANGEIDDPVAIATDTSSSSTPTTSTSTGGGATPTTSTSTGGSSSVSTTTTDTLDVKIRFNETDVNHRNNFKLEISEPLAIDASVSYTTRDGTAIAGQDYITTKDTAIIRAGKTSVLIKVDIIADNIAESEESFELVISNPQGAKFPANITEITATHTIVDDD
jgi:hypothetical protein